MSRDESCQTSAVHSQRGFLLLEIILAVAIFTVGVLSLGRCLNNCLVAQQIRGQEERARAGVWKTGWLEIQARPSLCPMSTRTTKLDGMYTGVTMIERRKALEVKNESNAILTDLHEITLTVEWISPDGRTGFPGRSRSICCGAGAKPDDHAPGMIPTGPADGLEYFPGDGGVSR